MSDVNYQIPVGSSAHTLSLRDFIVPAFRRPGLLLGVFLTVSALALLLAALMGPSYTSRMGILVNRERADPLVSTEATTQLITGENPVTQEEINSEIELLKSRDILEKVVEVNGLYRPADHSMFGFLQKGRSHQDLVERAVKRLAKQLKVDAVKTSNLIEISYSSGDPQLSYAVLKSLGDFYLAKHVEVNRPAGSYEFFAAQTDKYHDELQQAEQRLRDFGRQNNAAAPDEQRTELAGQVAASVGMVHQAEQAIAGDTQRLVSDRGQLKRIPDRMTTLRASAVNDKLIGDLTATMVAAEAKRTQLAVKYDPSYPLVREADEEIAAAKASLVDAEKKQYVTETTDKDPTYELLREDVAKTEADLAGQRASLVASKRGVLDTQAQMENLDQLSMSQQDLQREVKAAESNYLLYLSKREQERTTNALDVTRISNVAIAMPPAVPVLPGLSWPFLILVALGAGLLLSIGAVYAAEYFDPTFRTPAQVIEILDIPVVVSMPRKRA